MPELPYTLGLCRSCVHVKPINRVTVWGDIISTGYYCRRRMHEITGTDRCHDFQERDR